MIIINLDVMLAKRKMSVTELADRIGITIANVSLLKNGKVKAIKLATLNKICTILDCQPSDILEYRPDARTALQPENEADKQTLNARVFEPIERETY